MGGTGGITCPACGGEIQANSRFCQHCGKPVEQPAAPATAAQLLERSAAALWVDPVSTVETVDQYLTRFPDGPARLDMLVTGLAAAFRLNVSLMMASRFEMSYSDMSPVAKDVGASLPPMLANGLPTSARFVIDDPEQRQRIVAHARELADACAKVVGELFEEAQREATSLQAAVTDVPPFETRSRMVDDAAKHRDEGDLDTAERIMTELKGLEPGHFFHRNELGIIHERQGRLRDALREWLYGFFLAPPDAALAHNTMLGLVGFGLHPSAVEVACHHRRLVPDPDDGFVGFENLARACWAAQLAKVESPDDLSADAPDLLDAAVAKRPWLKEMVLIEPGRVFISYRHRDGGDTAARLESAYERRSPEARVFRDSSDLRGGEDWLVRLRGEIEAADVVFVLIDRAWARDRRFGDPEDVLRREVVWAIRKGAAIIPVLIDGAVMPTEKQLPLELKPLAGFQALPLRACSFDQDFEALYAASLEILADRQHLDKAVDERLREFEEGKRDLSELDAAIAALPKFVPRKARAGRGIRSSIEMCGTWTVDIFLRTHDVELRFTIEDETTFRGRQKTVDKRSRVVDERKIHGGWMRVADPDKDLLLGIVLDGVRGKEPFCIEIPFDRMAGNMIKGEDTQGAKYVCRNVAPRSGGF